MNLEAKTQNLTEGMPAEATNGARAVVCSATSAADRLRLVQDQIAHACRQAQRPVQSVTLIAVSKTQSPEAISQLAQFGQCQFAENYLQEALLKINALLESEHSLTWHFIGPIQSNKTLAIAQNFSWVHSVDRLKTAQRLSDQRPVDLPPLQIFLQVNTSQEDQKSGVPAARVIELAQQIALLPRLCLRGLMCIPRPSDLADPKEDFEAMRDLLAKLRQMLPPKTALQLDTLSMGMSADLQIAIAAGSTMVRVGTALFGARV